MPKKKRGVPKKECPKCGKRVHARRNECDCGYAFVKAAARKVAKKKAARRVKPEKIVGPAKRRTAGLKQLLKKEMEGTQSVVDSIKTVLEMYGDVPAEEFKEHLTKELEEQGQVADSIRLVLGRYGRRIK